VGKNPLQHHQHLIILSLLVVAAVEVTLVAAVALVVY
jgi:hypothetical protein